MSRSKRVIVVFGLPILAAPTVLWLSSLFVPWDFKRQEAAIAMAMTIIGLTPLVALVLCLCNIHLLFRQYTSILPLLRASSIPSLISPPVLAILFALSPMNLFFFSLSVFPWSLVGDLVGRS